MVDELATLIQTRRNIILDIDGTLVNSNDAHAHSFIDALEEHGIHTVKYTDLRKLIGMNGLSILRHMLPSSTWEEEGQNIDADRTRIFAERYMSQVEPTPGVIAFFTALREKNIRIALNSASPKSIVNHFVALLGVHDFIEGVTTAEDIAEGKPNPLSIEVCCETFGFSPAETLMVGDSPYDVIAAHEFSIDVIGLLTGGYEADELLKTGAIAVFNDLEHLHQTVFQSTPKR